MPFAVALFASVLAHAAALLGPGWALPGQEDAEPPPAVNAVLVKPAEAASPSKTRPAIKPATEKPRVVAAAPTVPSPVLPISPEGSAPNHSVGEPAVPNEAASTVAPPVAIALATKGQLRYVITKGASESGMVVGQSIHTWEHDGAHYTLKSVSETTGLAALFKPARVVQTSRGKVTSQGLQPEEFRHERAGGAVDTAVFDGTRHIVAYAGREEAVVDGTQDMLSLYYQLVLLEPRAETVSLPIATGRKLEVYRFEVLGEERIVPRNGEPLPALRLSAKSGNDTIDVWLALSGRALPLKIRFTDRQGEIFDQVVDSSEGTGKP